MSGALLISVRLHDGGYHGVGDWPPSPARLFQALVAGAGLSGPLGNEESRALEWLEAKSQEAPPLIGAPAICRGQHVMFYMPNNDLDRVGGDPDRSAEIRTAKKFFRPLLFDPSIPFLYVWALEAAEPHEPYSQVIRTLVDRLYQFGRGVDMAWAWADVLDGSTLEEVLSSYPGRIYRPSQGGSGRTLACPQRGSLQSLKARYEAYSSRFKSEGKSKKIKQTFFKAPRPSLRSVPYNSPPSRRVYDLREPSSATLLAHWPLARASKLVVCLRDRAVDRLRRTLPARQEEIERVLVGRKPDGTNNGPMAARVKIVPLPSIGHHHADRGIRRVLVEVPASCPLRAEDVHWAFSGLELIDPETGKAPDIILTPATDESMLDHYGIGEGRASRTWHSVTPVALPEGAARRRIEPTRRIAEAKDGGERSSELARAATAVTQALRHAEVRQKPEVIRAQREPFESNGERIEAFAVGTRFAKEGLWHIGIAFTEPLSGPLVIGDGRFLGLGVMAPLPRAQGIHAFVVESGLASEPDSIELARALRRAVMARVQGVLGSVALPTFFTGHESDGSAAQSERCPHLTFVFEPTSARLLVISPHVINRREPGTEELGHLRVLDQALADFRELRAGRSGRLMLRPIPIDADTDPLFAASRTWESVTPYVVTHHTKRVGAAEALSIDLYAECRRRGLPEPRVMPFELRGVPGIGLIGGARLTFKVAVNGPLVLGKNRHLGGGLFSGMTL